MENKVVRIGGVEVNLNKLGGIGLIILTLLTACGVKPDTTTEITGCGGNIELDVRPGDMTEVSGPGQQVQLVVNPDGSLTFKTQPTTTTNNRTIVGDPNNRHLVVINQGDTDGDGGYNLNFESICPLPPTPTVTPVQTPTPPETPIGLLKGNQRTLTQQRGGFYPGKASKPAPHQSSQLQRLCRRG